MAKELICSGRHVRAEEALRIGLVNRICPKEVLLETCEATAKEICANSLFAVLQGKRAVDAGGSLAMHEALELERNMCAVAFGTPDRLEGMTAFIEKREPAFA
jgi:enoyl-CoA hydratase